MERIETHTSISHKSGEKLNDAREEGSDSVTSTEDGGQTRTSVRKETSRDFIEEGLGGGKNFGSESSLGGESIKETLARHWAETLIVILKDTVVGDSVYWAGINTGARDERVTIDSDETLEGRGSKTTNTKFTMCVKILEDGITRGEIVGNMEETRGGNNDGRDKVVGGGGAMITEDMP